MKCILTLATGKVKRVKDQRARDLANLPEFKLVPKWRWKDQQGIEYRGKRFLNAEHVSVDTTK